MFCAVQPVFLFYFLVASPLDVQDQCSTGEALFACWPACCGGACRTCLAHAQAAGLLPACPCILKQPPCKRAAPASITQLVCFSLPRLQPRSWAALLKTGCTWRQR